MYFIILSIIIFPLIQEIQENVSARKEVKRNVERCGDYINFLKYRNILFILERKIIDL